LDIGGGLFNTLDYPNDINISTIFFSFFFFFFNKEESHFPLPIKRLSLKKKFSLFLSFLGMGEELH
jgi:hypothetical protein